jgi:hypothetical protein
VLILGIILAILGAVLTIPTLENIGLILVIIGVTAFFLGALGHPLLGRQYWY